MNKTDVLQEYKDAMAKKRAAESKLVNGDIRAHMRALYEMSTWAKNRMARKDVPESKLYKCRKCGSRRIMHRSAQLRSADEGMDVLCACTKCGQQWTVRN
ncbi:MAG: hypothetical protein CMK92_00435 [Pseudomonas sp.]|nr:hypothetical protein [Pseudomonas sp.]